VAVSFIGGGNCSTRRKSPTCRKSQTNFTWNCITYTSPWAGFELTTIVVIWTYYTGSCKSNYHTIPTKTTLCHKSPRVCSAFHSHNPVLSLGLQQEYHDGFHWWSRDRLPFQTIWFHPWFFCPFSFGHCIACPSSIDGNHTFDNTWRRDNCSKKKDLW
jgi:hypothetical protein